MLKQRGLCELIEIAEILSIVNVKVFRFFIHKLYLFDCMKTLEPRTIKITKDPHNFKQTEDITPATDKGFL